MNPTRTTSKLHSIENRTHIFELAEVGKFNSFQNSAKPYRNKSTGRIREKHIKNVRK